MKHIKGLILLLLTLSTPVIAKVQFGPSIGISNVHLENTDSGFDSNRLGTAIGASLGYKFKKGLLGIQPEVRYNYYSFVPQEASLTSLITTKHVGNTEELMLRSRFHIHPQDFFSFYLGLYSSTLNFHYDADTFDDDFKHSQTHATLRYTLGTHIEFTEKPVLSLNIEFGITNKIPIKTRDSFQGQMIDYEDMLQFSYLSVALLF